jgi:16S rRNA (guanine527-N7)-methyltransferase
VKLTEKKEVERLFRGGLKQLGLALDNEQLNSLVLYCLELLKWSRKINLVAKDTPLPDLVDKHFFDSLTLVPLLARQADLTGPLLDVGSGAGFPGLVVKIACPSLEIVLLEPRQRRVAFLRHIIRLLALDGIDVMMCRTEELGFEAAKPFKVITGRAVADVTDFLRMVAHLASPASLVICMQGSGGTEKWRNLGDTEGFQCIGVEEAVLPFSSIKRYFLLFRKF